MILENAIHIVDHDPMAVARMRRNQMRAVYGAVVLCLIQLNEMTRRRMIPDFCTFRNMLGPKVLEGGDGASYIYHGAG